MRGYRAWSGASARVASWRQLLAHRHEPDLDSTRQDVGNRLAGDVTTALVERHARERGHQHATGKPSLARLPFAALEDRAPKALAHVLRIDEVGPDLGRFGSRIEPGFVAVRARVIAKQGAPAAP